MSQVHHGRHHFYEENENVKAGLDDSSRVEMVPVEEGKGIDTGNLLPKFQ